MGGAHTLLTRLAIETQIRHVMNFFKNKTINSSPINGESLEQITYNAEDFKQLF